MNREVVQSEKISKHPDEEDDKEPIPRPALLNVTNLMDNKKDKEIEELKKELQNKSEKLSEFEYLIVKASEEVRKKQAEITELKNLVELYRPAYEQLPELREHLTTRESEYSKNTREIQLRVEVQKEKEHSASLQEAYNQAKSKADSLERQLASLSSKSTKLEKELEELTRLNDQITMDAQVKDKTIDNAEVVIKRLMKEKETLMIENESFKVKCQEATEKAKKYKGKVKSLKALQLKKNEALKTLEGQSNEAEKLRNELEQYRLDFANAMRAKINERKEHADEIKALKDEQSKVRAEVEEILKENKLLIEEKNGVLAELKACQEQCQHLQRKIVEKEKEFELLQNLLDEEKCKYKIELETITSQASRVLNIVAKSEENTNTQPSPFYFTLPPLHNMTHQTPLNTGRLNTGTQQIPVQEISQFENLPQKRASVEQPMMMSGKFKSTPLKTTNSGQLVLAASNQKVQEVDVSQYTLGKLEEQEKSSTRETEPVESKGNDAQKQPQQQQQQTQQQVSQPSLSVEDLKIDLQQSIDREAYLIQLIERIAAEHERELKTLQEKLTNQPALPPSVEAEMMQREELSQRFEDINFKYFKACKLIQELQDFCSQLTAFIADASTCSGFWSQVTNQYSELTLDGANNFSKQFSDLLKESQNLKQISEDTISKLTSESSSAQSELKAVKEIIDLAYEKMIPQSDDCSPKEKKAKDTSQTLPSKIKALLGHLEQVIAELQNKNDLLLSYRHTPTLGSFVDNTPENEEGLNYTVARGIHSEEIQQAYVAEFRRRVDELQQREKLKDKEIVKRDQTIQELEIEIETWQRKFKDFDGQLIYYQQKFRNYEAQNEEITQLRKLLVAKDQELLEKARLIYQYKNDTQNSSSLDITNLKRQLTEKETALVEKTRENEILKKSLHLRQFSNSMQMQATEIENILNTNSSLNIYSQQQEERSSFQENSPVRTNRHQANNSSLRRGPESPPPQSARGICKMAPMSNKEPVEDTFSGKYTETRLRAELEELRSNCATLKEENKELLKKLNMLNGLAGQNHLVETEYKDTVKVVPFRQPTFQKSPSVHQTNQLSETDLLTQEPAFAFEYEVANAGMSVSKFETNDRSLNQQFESYKQQTKKVFKKRVKELELILRVIDEKIKGFRFDQGEYLTHAVKPEALAPQETETLMAMYSQANELLEKNPSLKTFINDICANVDALYLAFYNNSVVLANAIKLVFSRDRENSPSGLPLMEKLANFQIPSLAGNISGIPLKKFSQRNCLGSLFWQFDFKQYSRLKEELASQLCMRKTPEIASELYVKAGELVRKKNLQLKEVENSLKRFKEVFYSELAQNSTLSAHKYETSESVFEMTFDIAQSMIEEAYNLLGFIGKMRGGDEGHRPVGKSKILTASPANHRV